MIFKYSCYPWHLQTENKNGSGFLDCLEILQVLRESKIFEFVLSCAKNKKGEWGRRADLETTRREWEPSSMQHRLNEMPLRYCKSLYNWMSNKQLLQETLVWLSALDSRSTSKTHDNRKPELYLFAADSSDLIDTEMLELNFIKTIFWFKRWRRICRRRIFRKARLNDLTAHSRGLFSFHHIFRCFQRWREATARLKLTTQRNMTAHAYLYDAERLSNIRRYVIRSWRIRIRHWRYHKRKYYRNIQRFSLISMRLKKVCCVFFIQFISF